MTTNTQAQARILKGVREAGQFTSTSHGDAAVILTTTTGQGQLGELGDSSRLLAMAKDAADYWQERYQQKGKSNTVSADDIAQEALVRYFERVRTGKPISDHRQLINSIAANVTVRATENVFRAEDRRAYRRFDEKRTAAEHELNRSLTPREQDRLAQQVLDEWDDPRHKPSKDFRIARTVDRSLNVGIGEDGGMTLGDTLVAAETDDGVAEDSHMGQAQKALMDAGPAGFAQARRLAWNALAEAREAEQGEETPLALAGILTSREATRNRALVTGKGAPGVLAACKAWSKGTDDENVTAALFAPFGPIGFADQERVVDQLESIGRRVGPEKADDMWSNTVSYAATKPTTQGGE
ncbi:hypothetical protein V6N00_12925 [Tersicoccus sp. MR15.9]|uniref:hypothetical protein n=1 Tax=Tersicoccus mangrovi TaxID=3121635 RepID=UPI002FE6C412